MARVNQSFDKEALKKRRAILGRDPEQCILNLIQQSCSHVFAQEDFHITLQKIKASFVQRDYDQIFNDPENLQVYSAAYVPGRALCYFNIFCRPELQKLLARSLRIYAVGAGSGSELVGLAAAMTRVPVEQQKVHLTLQDLGDWAKVLRSYENIMRNSWQLNHDHFTIAYQKGDVLYPENRAQQTDNIGSAGLITLMFVVNELFTRKAAAMEFFQDLIISMKKGAYLLVVESAGSFSHLRVGDKTYMVYTLLDALKGLRRIIAEDSEWYRYPEHLKYPMDIQNMRYFIRLYKKL